MKHYKGKKINTDFIVTIKKNLENKNKLNITK